MPTRPVLMHGAMKVKSSVRVNIIVICKVVQEVESSIVTPSVTEDRIFEVDGAVCTGSSIVDAEVEGSVLLCGDCAELERPGVRGTSSPDSVGESARLNLFIFLSTFVEVSIIHKVTSN